jgi:hypothetical protein
VASDAPTDSATIASHTLAYLRSHDKKLDLILETLGRHGERLGRLERDMAEMKSDVVSLENKVLTAQTEILTVLHTINRTPENP